MSLLYWPVFGFSRLANFSHFFTIIDLLEFPDFWDSAELIRVPNLGNGWGKSITAATVTLKCKLPPRTPSTSEAGAGELPSTSNPFTIVNCEVILSGDTVLAVACLSNEVGPSKMTFGLSECSNP